MNKRDENMEWEMEASHLAALPRVTPYRVPDNYFNDLQERINQAVFVDGLMHKEDQGFTVPKNYFEDLSEQIEGKIAVDRLSSLIANDGFKTPPAYFEKLNEAILSKTTQTSQTKVVRLWQSDLMKYASAACFILLTAAGLYLNQQQSVKQNLTAELASEQMLYDIDESVIIEHIQENAQVNTIPVSDTEIENYILDNYSSSDLTNNL